MCYAYMYMYFVRILRNHHCLWGIYQCSWLSWVNLAYKYIHTNLYTIICLIFIKIIPITLPMKLRPHEQGKFWLLTNFDPHKKKMIPQ